MPTASALPVYSKFSVALLLPPNVPHNPVVDWLADAL
jgi:hypothetical protein